MTLDDRSERNLATLHPDLHQRAATFVAAAKNLAAQRSLDVRIISALRSYAEQETIYAQGRTTLGKIVTNARAGYSNHNFGLAFDVGVFKGKAYLDDHAFYDELGPLGESLGLEWGGRWKFVDKPHYQFRPAWSKNMTERELLASLRRRVAEKVDILA
jgi:peptidoglycan L-alanyl-D-glutamate endopeptidase CwlK